MSDWEARDSAHLARLLVGDHFGDRPEDRLDAIRADKQKRAAYLCRKTRATRASVVLEIGSGMGFTSRHVAEQVKRLYCADISASFLDVAAKECAGIDNIEFVRLDDMPGALPFDDAAFDIVFSDAVFIHLNLYDIFWYFSAFQRVVRPGGRVFINIMNGAKVDLGKLTEMAGYYRRDRGALKRLLCWHSVDSVAAVASHFGFELESKGRWRGLVPTPTVDLLFRKR